MIRTKQRLYAIVVGAVLAVLSMCACCGMAWADEDLPNSQYESVTFTVGTTSSTYSVDLESLIGTQTKTPVYGEFYKNSRWNVLATNRYATIDSIIQNAVSQYNAVHSSNLTVSDVWYSGKSISVQALETDSVTGERYVADYAKYTWSYDEMTAATHFFNVTNATTVLPLTPSHTNVGAVLAYCYGSGKVGIDGADTDTVASNVLSSASTSEYPRLILGCESGWDTTQAMGKRYCYDVVSLTIS